MNATELFHQDGRTAGVFYCGECRHVARTREQADGCCAPYKCTRCGVDVPRKNFRTVCPPCEEAKRQEKEAARFAAAEKVTEWDGWIYSEGHGHSDGYFRDPSELREWIEEDSDEGAEMPAYVWTCTEESFARTSMDQITDPISENAYEDFDCDSLEGIDALQSAIDAFNEANKRIVSYLPNYKRALILGKSNVQAKP
jgi:hypothetical protein